MSFDMQIILAVGGGIISLVTVVFGFGFRFAKFENMTKHNRDYIDNIERETMQNKQDIEKLSVRLSDISDRFVEKIGAELQPVKDCVLALTERTVSSETSIRHFKDDVAEIKEMFREIKKDIKEIDARSLGKGMRETE